MIKLDSHMMVAAVVAAQALERLAREREIAALAPA